ncbi:metallophosphoesterase [Corynebacterium yudongzhengii]|uniref:metallophosphoesterase n=1 Tax=Corynebacterium yudongzhengii TaxID=2080740 RepID=UPI001F303FBA|nr:metallophosphoesterase [Corynebacterium yudongzhengii]
MPSHAEEDLGSRFSLGVLPDTQFYARYGTEAAGDIFGSRYGSNPYDVQTQFFADNHAKLNMPFVTHLGDVVDEPEDDASWDVASNAMQRLEAADVDYSVLPGNHDLDMRGEASAFETYFPESRAAENETFGDAMFQRPTARSSSPNTTSSRPRGSNASSSRSASAPPTTP